MITPNSFFPYICLFYFNGKAPKQLNCKYTQKKREEEIKKCKNIYLLSM